MKQGMIVEIGAIQVGIFMMPKRTWMSWNMSFKGEKDEVPFASFFLEIEVFCHCIKEGNLIWRGKDEFI